MMAGSSPYKVPFIRPSLPSSEEISEDYKKIVESNWFTNFGPYERRFCEETARFVDQETYVTTAANATLAIDLAVRALLKKDSAKKQVIVPSFTFPSAVAVLVSHGYTPVLIDVDKAWQPDLSQAKKYLKDNTEKVSGIILTNTFGVGNQKVGLWEKLAHKYSLPLIIDSAAGFGSQYEEGTHVGAHGDCEIFSLHATKPFAVGEGGLLVSRSPELIERVRSLQNFGYDSSRNITAVGTNAKLQELNCAIGLRQLEKLKDRIKNRQELLAYYKEGLQDLGFSFQENDHLSTVPFVSTMAPAKKVVDKMLKALHDGGVEVKRYYAPLHLQDIFHVHAEKPFSFHTTEKIASRILSLPLHDTMNKQTIDEIVGLMARS